MATPGEKMNTPSASFVPIGQTEEGIILQNTATGETKIQPLDFTAQRRRAKKQNAPVKERPFYDLSNTGFAEDHFLRSNPGSTPEDYRTILSIQDGVRTGNPDLMMSVGQGADTVENALMSVEGAAPVTAEGDGPKPGTGATVANIPKDSDGNFIVSPTQFDQLIKQSLGGLSRARAATKEATGIDYQEQPMNWLALKARLVKSMTAKCANTRLSRNASSHLSTKPSKKCAWPSKSLKMGPLTLTELMAVWVGE